MKVETKNKILAELEGTEVFENLRDEICGYRLKKIFTEDGDKFYYFSYENENHRAFMAYFHEETFEYKVRVKIGLTEFCLTKFFTGNFQNFIEILNAEMQPAIEKLSALINPKTDLLIADKNFSDWNYSNTLPKNLEGFELFITPENPAKITNGSYIILNYSDFENNMDLTIYYNVYTEKFSGETKVNFVPNVSYLFDAETLKDLEMKLKKNLASELLKLKKFHDT